MFLCIKQVPDCMALSSMDISQHEHQLAQLKKEKEQALAEEMKTTKAGKYK